MDSAKKLLAVALLFTFSQLALADDVAAAKTIADVVASMNHFPSADQKTALRAVSEDNSVDSSLQTIAATVSNIQHSPTDEGKQALNRIIGSDQASAEAKALAQVVAGFNHAASAEGKAALAALR